MEDELELALRRLNHGEEMRQVRLTEQVRGAGPSRQRTTVE